MSTPEPARDPAHEPSRVPAAAPTSAPAKPLMRSLGEFFGHVWNGITADTHPDRKTNRSQVVRREVQETRIETPAGPVTLRRTTVDEIEPPRA